MSDDKKYFTLSSADLGGITLPSGIYGVQDAGWIGYDGYWNKDKEKKKCECGAWITYGKECPPEFHAPTYCPIYEKPKEDK